jgi:hypothetical protein
MNHLNRITLNALAAPVRRRRARWLASTIGALLIGTASAALPLKTIEECLESGTDLVKLPGMAGGSLSASQCRGCPSVRLRFVARTRYFIGKEQVTYARLQEAAAKGDLQLDLFYDPKTLNLTRLRLVAAGNDK